MANAQSEPSMDEILASIRRIISEEDEATSEAPDTEAGSKPAAQDPLQLDDESAVEPSASPVNEDESPAPNLMEETVQDAPQTPDIPTEPASDMTPAEEPTVTPFPASETAESVGGNVETTSLPQASPSTSETAASPAAYGEPTASPAASLSSQIADSLLSDGSAAQAAEAFGSLERNVRLSSGSGRTIEDLVEAMLAPMIKGWLDDNLPRIVEEKVEEEVRRIARRG